MTKRNVLVRNVTRGGELMSAGRIADNPWTRLKGLIGVKHLPAGDGLLIKPCNGVHCMFMSIPIDVIYVDKQDRVLGICEDMAPWRVGRVYRQGHYVIELPVGVIAKSGTQAGDVLHVTVTA